MSEDFVVWSDTQVTLLHRAGYQSQCLLSVCDLQSERWLCKLICLAVVYVCVCVWGPSHAALLPLRPMTQQKCVTHHLQISQSLQSLEEAEAEGNTPEGAK